jgi:glycosyltransferase involved in cell wall biosynthesis
MDTNKELNGLKMTYIGAADLEGTGAFGGARVKNMVSLFKRLGIKIHLITYSFISDKFGIEHKEIDQSLRTTTVHMRSNLPRFLKAFAIFPVFFYAWKSCKNSDVIFSDLINILSSVPAIMLGKIFNKPTILDYDDMKHIKVIPESVNECVAKNADAIFAISYYLIEFARLEYDCKNVIYMPNCIDINRFKIDWMDREKIRGELGIKKNEIVIGYVGSFFYVEGVPFLLQAFKNLTNKYPKIKLAIMGRVYFSKGDDDIPKLVEDMNIKNEVILIPSQSHERVPRFLSAFDILCCPKIDCEINRAANPVKVPEYLSMGLPTVCSAVGGIIDTIEDGVDGFLIKPGDVKDLEEKLEWIILNPERAKEIGENGRRTVIEKYSYEAIESTIRQAVRGIVDMKKGKKGLK